MESQQEYWDRQHRSWVPARRDANPFAIRVAARLGAPGRVLELGCVGGHDTGHFAACGYLVTALDISPMTIDIAASTYDGLEISFESRDFSEPLPYDAESFDLVYSHLALHYFSDGTRRVICEEAARVLHRGGLFAFACRSVLDRLYGEGEEVDPDMFYHGHVRHLFDEEYTRSCLARDFEDAEVAMTKPEADGSAFVEVMGYRR